ncbi:MAG: tRNA (guanosine(46)-N7)-methyltransferase TrmB, partial [Firmicutes bacterium]|nr:tRNA (guanosine(46)-N7)-methyltransferase TrmB [Bacillota bacterium]
MRQRGVKHKDEIVKSCEAWLAKDPKALRGAWNTVFGNDRPIHLEIGSGKGRFITSLAALHPEINYLACEGGENIYVRILQKAAEAELAHLRVIDEYIIRASEYFAEGELSGIYINFCD